MSPVPVSGKRFADFQDVAWHVSILRRILIATLSASATTGLVVVWAVLTGLPGSLVLFLAFLVALGGVTSTLRLGRPQWRDRRGMAYRLGEMLVILIVVRIGTWAGVSGWPEPSDLAVWVIDPALFFDGYFVFAGVMSLLAWSLALGVTGDFLDLAIQPDEVAAVESRTWGDTQSQWRAFRPVSRSDILGRFLSRWAWGGMALIFLAALSQVRVAADARGVLGIGLVHLGLPPVLLGGLVVYFLSGLLLASDARLALLRGRWYNQEVQVAPRVLGRWHISSVLIVAVVALIALLLPLGTTGWLAAAIEWLLALAFRLMMLLFLVLGALFSGLLYLFRWLFGEPQGGAPQERELVRPVVPTQAQVTSQLPEWLGGAVLWTVVGVVTVYLLVTFLRSNDVFEARVGGLWSRLRFWWRARRARVDAALSSRVSRLRARFARRRRAAPAGEATPLRRTGTLAPRERVRYYYLRVLGRAAESGRARPPHVTPLEFVRDLEQSWPDAEPDVEALTEAFVAARYTPEEIEGSALPRVQAAWRRTMRALRRPARGEGESE